MSCHVYFNEYNPYLGQTAYLPLVAGKLTAYAQTDPAIAEHYHFEPVLFRIDRPDEILAAYEDPGVAAFSAAIWNEQLCLHVAREVKRRYPACLIVFGGTQVPHDPRGYMQEHSFIDVCSRGEGEEAFKQLLARLIDSREFSGVPNIVWRDEGGALRHNADAPKQERDLDIYPSPYLEGLYEQLIADNPETRFQAIVETNRGCPFLCTFCYWGKGGLSRKYRYFSVDRVRAEFDWFGRHDVAFVYNADSNFGMNRRDEEVAQIMVETKQRYGAPEKVVNLYGKNTNERIYQIGKLLSDNGMHKGMGLSRQSMNPDVLDAIKRQNIKLSVYQTLQERFEKAGVSVFSELIIGLPGETYESLAEGIEELLSLSFGCQLLIVMCEVYPNTEMADPAYIEQHGLHIKRNRSVGLHSRELDASWVTEYIPYIVGTKTMPPSDWRRACLMSFTTMAMTGLRIGYYLMQYLRQRYGTRHIDFLRFLCEARMSLDTAPVWRAELGHYTDFVDQILRGEGRAVMCPEFGDIYWAIEEATFLRLTDRADAFYGELTAITAEFLDEQGVYYDVEELREAVRFQRLCVPSVDPSAVCGAQQFLYNFPQYFEALDRGQAVELEPRPQVVSVHHQDYRGDRERFAREKLLWARRGGKFAPDFSWHDSATTSVAAKRPQPHDVR
jgi:radical SAM superfamily enzyme YgiQ (UPF0313 family)